MKLIIYVLFIVLFASTSSGNESSHSLAAENFLENAQYEQDVLNNQNKAFEAIDSQIKEAKSTPGNEDAVKSLETIKKKLSEIYSWSQLKPIYSEAVKSVFSEKELDQLSDFFLSPVGQNYFTKQNILSENIEKLTQQHLRQGLTTLSENLAHKVIKESASFRHSIQFAGLSHPEPDYTLPPSGVGKISGKFLFDGAPAKGIRLEVILNNKYKTAILQTDENGIFNINVPIGVWYINSIHTINWQDKPVKGKLHIYTGLEGTIGDYKKNPFGRLSDHSYQINLDETKPRHQLTLKIRRRIDLLWPNELAQKAKSDIGKSILHWSPFPEAIQYLVWLTSIEATERGTSESAAYSTVLKGETKLPLSKLPTIKDGSTNEYHIQLFAFTKGGALLAKSATDYRPTTFMLEGYKIEKMIAE